MEYPLPPPHPMARGTHLRCRVHACTSFARVHLFVAFSASIYYPVYDRRRMAFAGREALEIVRSGGDHVAGSHSRR